jgi:hypothetical protein
MGFVPVEFCPDDAPVSEAYFSFPLHFAPSSAAALFFEARKFPDAFADGDDLDARNLFQYIKIRHRATTVPLFQEPRQGIEHCGRKISSKSRKKAPAVSI